MEQKNENPKREALRLLSVQARALKEKRMKEAEEAQNESEAFFWAALRVNDIIIKEFYTNEEHSDFATLRGWNERGFKVKKGSTAFVIWGQKRRTEKVAPEPKPEGQEGDEFEFFPLAYLFSNAQVEPFGKNEEE